MDQQTNPSPQIQVPPATPPQIKRPFIKRFWWLLLLLIIAALVILGPVRGSLHDRELAVKKEAENKEQMNPEPKKDSWNELRDLVSSPSMPSCPTDISGIFTKPFMTEGPDYIIPLGNSSQTGHVVPADHVYPILKERRKDPVAYYAPSDITLAWIEIKQMHNADNDEVLGNDYQLNFAPCRGINLAFIHFTDLSDKLKAAIDFTDLRCSKDGSKHGYQEKNGMRTYYITCHPAFRNVTLKAGEIIGTYGKYPQWMGYGVDIGLYNYNKPQLGFINPERYYVETLHTECFADYYTPALKAKYRALFGGPDFDKVLNKEVIKKRTTEPVCGSVFWDLAGTAQGTWFKNPIRQKYWTDNGALVLIHDNVLPDLGKISMHETTGFLFTPTHSGQVNREFSEVTPDGKIYCYNRGEVKREKVILQLIDNTHVKAERQDGICGASEAFRNPTIWER